MEKNVEVRKAGFYVEQNGGIVNSVFFAENIREESVELAIPTPTEENPEAFILERKKALVGDLCSLSCNAATYAQLVSACVRLRYSQDDVEAIILNGRAEELAELNEWRAACKTFAKTVFTDSALAFYGVEEVPEEEMFPREDFAAANPAEA